MNEKITVLYVDDEPVNLMLFESTLAKYYKIITVSSGKEGFEALREKCRY